MFHRLLGIAVAAILFIPGAMAQSNESFRPVVWGPIQTPSNLVQYSAVFQSGGGQKNLHFLNVVRDDNVWVVQNLPVGLESGLSQIATVINGDLFENGRLYHTTFNKRYQREAPTYEANQAVVRILDPPVNYLVNGGACRDGAGVFVIPGDPPTNLVNFPPPPFPLLPPFKVVYRDSVPDIPQGPNECAPTSAANSLSWMEDVYGEIAIGMTTEEIRDELKGVNFMNTSAVSGTSDADFVSGKNAFAEAHALPITTAAVGGGVGVAPGMDDLFAALEQGADVELSVLWKDENGNNDGGHWVTLVGMIEIQGQYGVYINDPDDGEDQAQLHWVDQNPDGTHSLRGYGGRNVIDLCIAEKVVRPGICGGGGAMIAAPPIVLLLFTAVRRKRVRR